VIRLLASGSRRPCTSYTQSGLLVKVPSSLRSLRRGGRDIQKYREASLAGADGVIAHTKGFGMGSKHPPQGTFAPRWLYVPSGSTKRTVSSSYLFSSHFEMTAAISAPYFSSIIMWPLPRMPNVYIVARCATILLGTFGRWRGRSRFARTVSGSHNRVRALPQWVHSSRKSKRGPQNTSSIFSGG
jgi:hypothetical protein